MASGGMEADARSSQYQRWHCIPSAAVDTSSDNTFHLDDVMGTSIKAEITFFERSSYRYPTPGCVALVTGKFFFTKGTAEPELRVRAEPIRV
jgi:hypothetical protein